MDKPLTNAVEIMIDEIVDALLDQNLKPAQAKRLLNDTIRVAVDQTVAEIIKEIEEAVT